jgi:hypothetical protein
MDFGAEVAPTVTNAIQDIQEERARSVDGYPEEQDTCVAHLVALARAKTVVRGHPYQLSEEIPT